MKEIGRIKRRIFEAKKAGSESGGRKAPADKPPE